MKSAAQLVCSVRVARQVPSSNLWERKFPSFLIPYSRLTGGPRRSVSFTVSSVPGPAVSLCD
jgi:hypothetical protein